MTDESNDQAQAGRKWTTLDYLWRGALVAVTLFVVFASALSFWYFVQHRHYQRELEETVAEIKSSGGPLEVAEIEGYYRVPEGMEDLTPEYLQAIAIFLRRQQSPTQQSTEDALLPIVGTNAKESLVGSDWDLRTTAEKYLDEFQPSLEQLRALSQRSGGVRYPVKLADNIAALLPHVQAIRDAARHLQLDIELQLLAGNREQALRDLLAMLQIGETLRDEPVLISQLVRYAVFGMFVKQAGKLLDNGAASETELQQLADALRDIDFQTGLKRALTGERSLSYLAVKTLDSSKLSELSGNGNQYVPNVGPLMDLRPGDTAHLLQFETEMIEAADGDFPDVLENMQRVDDRLKAEIAYQTLPWNKNILTQTLLPAVSSVAFSTARSLALRDSLRAAVAIEQMERRTGKWPTSLTELVPDYLPAVPRDPFDGNSLRYSVSDDSYVVYSVGMDKVDNGGQIADMQTDVGVRIQITPPSTPP